MKKPPTPKQIIEGKEPNELTDLLEMESPVEKAWDDLKEATENYNKEALRAMDETPKENINETNQSVVIGENITTKEILSRQDLTTPYLVGFKEGKEEARQEILGMIEAYIDDNDDGMWACREACDDLSHRIEERYKSE